MSDYAPKYYIEERDPLHKSFFKFIASMIFNSIQYIVILITMFVIVYLFILTPHIVEGRSMQPNFCNHDLYVTYKLNGIFFGYQHEDVIAFKKDDANNYIKRVVGVGGDVIKIENGSVYRNGELLKESYLPPGRLSNLSPSDLLQEGVEYKVPEGKYFVMGDNRDNSTDSRNFLAIDPQINTIDGRVVLVFWPFDRLRVFNDSQVYPENECESTTVQ